MKVVLLVGFFDEAFVYREHAYAKYLKQRGIDYLILTSTKPLVQKKKKELSKDTGQYSVLRKPPFFQFKDLILFRIYRELDRIRPNVIHLFDAQQGIAVIGAIWAMRNNVPILYDHELQRVPRGRMARMRYNLVTQPAIRFILQHARTIRTVTPAAENLLKSIYPAAFPKMHLRTLGYIEAGTVEEKELALPPEVTIIALTGYFDLTKKIKPIIAAFTRLAAKRSDVHLMVVGPVEDVKVGQYIGKQPRVTHITKLLPQSQLNFLLKRSRINIWPKSTATIFEALQYDNYVILPYNDQTSHLTSRQVKLLQTFDCFTIRREIEVLLDAGKVSDHEHFNYRVIVDELVAEYQQLL